MTILHTMGAELLTLTDVEWNELLTRADPNERAVIYEALETAQAQQEIRNNLGVWAEQELGYTNAPFHWEWYGYIQAESRLVLLAPRDHAKSQTVTINQSAWRSIYTPMHWSYVFALTKDLAEGLLERINETIGQAAPWMLDVPAGNKREWTYANGSKVTVAGAGKAVRGAHPDLIVGDDVLDEKNTLTHLQRKRMERWWLGTIDGMAHPGDYRRHNGQRVWMPPTRVHLVGTPFHSADLLMTLKTNPMFRWRRYSAEFDQSELRDGLAVEAA